ncbi:MAG: tetratricopeptide repeat protein [Roseococcus sp.]
MESQSPSRLILAPATLPLLGRGLLAAARQDWTRARTAFTAVVERHPRISWPWTMLGHAALRCWDFPAAEAAYRQACRLSPRSGAAHQYLAYALERRGQGEAALAAFRQAAELSPKSPEPAFGMARVLQMIGRTEEALTWIRRASALAPRHQRITRQAARMERDAALADYDGSAEPPPLRVLRNVMIGTTGICNASCIHCPTNKPETEAAPRNTMPMGLFEKLVHELRDGGIIITDQVSFGLFGDGLLDPHVVARARMLQRALPGTRIVVNTNGAAFNRGKHAALRRWVSVISVHIESLRPEVYNRLMAPLRLNRVLPKCDEIMRSFPGKVAISVPVSRLNLNELDGIREYFQAQGALKVEFDPLSSRCSEDQRLFRSLALDPQPIRCGPQALDDLIVDCDGAVLVCCQDFARREVIGNLADSSLEEILHNLPRAKVRARFARGEHLEMKTCARCHADLRTSMPDLVAAR